MTAHTDAEPRAAIPVRPKESVLWSSALVALVAGALGTELLPLMLGSHVGFIYVTMKFILLPGGSVILLAIFLARLFGDGHLPLQAWLLGVAAAAYLAALALWPLPWFS